LNLRSDGKRPNRVVRSVKVARLASVHYVWVDNPKHNLYNAFGRLTVPYLWLAPQQSRQNFRKIPSGKS